MPVVRGSLAWSEVGGDGPTFFIALADFPHLGVAHTVWAEVVDQDLPILDAIARDIAAGRQELPIAMSLHRVL